MKRTALVIAVAAIGLGPAAWASASSKSRKHRGQATFKAGNYAGHTSQRCQAGATGQTCSPGAPLPISFTVRRNPFAQTLIINLVWTEDDTCTLPPPFNGSGHSTLTQSPNDVVVAKSGTFSFTTVSQGATIHLHGQLRGKRASGTISDVYHEPSGVSCSTGTVQWSARTK